MKKVFLALSALTLAGSVMAAPVTAVDIDPPLFASSSSVSMPDDIDPPLWADFMDAFGGDIDPPLF